MKDKTLTKMAVTVAAAAVMLKEVLNMRKLPGMLTSPAELVEKLVLLGNLYKTCKFVGYGVLSEQFAL
jgi:hypothetical protein